MSFQFYLQAAQLIPVAIQLAKTLEEMVPGPGKGKEKLATLRSILEGAYSSSQAAAGVFEKLWPYIEGAVTSAVGRFNNLGIFKKSTPTT